MLISFILQDSHSRPIHFFDHSDDEKSDHDRRWCGPSCLRALSLRDIQTAQVYSRVTKESVRALAATVKGSKTLAKRLLRDPVWEQNVRDQDPSRRRLLSYPSRPGVSMDASAHDLLLVGGGAVGVRAIIATAELNAGNSIVIISNIYPMRRHTVSAQGGVPVVVNQTSTDMHTPPFQVLTGFVISNRSRPLSKKRLRGLCDARIGARHSSNRFLKAMT